MSEPTTIPEIAPLESREGDGTGKVDLEVLVGPVTASPVLVLWIELVMKSELCHRICIGQAICHSVHVPVSVKAYCDNELWS
jgi:hypothetical protein